MRFFIDVDLILKLCMFSIIAILVLLVDIFILLKRKKSYISNMIWNRGRFVVWITSIWLFGLFPLWISLIMWFVAFFLFKYFIFKKDITYIYYLCEGRLVDDVVCKSFGECIRSLFAKPIDHLQISTDDFKHEFSFLEYSNTLICVAVYYLFGIVSLYPDLKISFVVGIYLVALSIFLFIARLIYALLNQIGNFVERGLYSYIKILIVGIVYLVVLTLCMKNLGYFTF